MLTLCAVAHSTDGAADGAYRAGSAAGYQRRYWGSVCAHAGAHTGAVLVMTFLVLTQLLALVLCSQCACAATGAALVMGLHLCCY